MKLKKLIAVAVLAAGAAPAFADLPANEDLTSRGGDLVKNRWGECVTVNANKGLTGCGVQPPAPEPPKTEMVTQTETITLAADTYFDFDKYKLKPTGKEALQQLAGDLNQRTSRRLPLSVIPIPKALMRTTRSCPNVVPIPLPTTLLKTAFRNLLSKPTVMVNATRLPPIKPPKAVRKTAA